MTVTTNDEEKLAAATSGTANGSIKATPSAAPQSEHANEEKEKKGHSGSSSASTTASAREGSEDHQEEEEDRARDLEALSNVESIAPVHSVFSKKQKNFIVFMTSIAGFFSPISANIYFPALNTLSRELHVSSTLINLTLTTYMIFQGLAPTVFGDLADAAGRRPAYIIGFIIYIGANIGLALQNSYPALLILRMVQSSGSSGTIALGTGVVADIATASERGKYMGWATSGPMIAPAIGPVLGGILAQFLGWRWIFWILVIAAAVFLVPFVMTFPETGRNVVGNGSIPPQGWNMTLLNYIQARKALKESDQLSRTTTRESNRRAQAELAKKRKLRFPNPLHVLPVIAEKDVGLLLLYNSLVYTSFYDVIASAPYLLETIYGYNDLQIGLCFLAFGVGAFAAPMTVGRCMDWNYRRVARQVGFTIDRRRGDDLAQFPLELARIQVAVPFVAVGNTATLIYGWMLEIETSVAVPLVLHFVMGLFLTGAFNVMSVMLVDLYPQSPSTATAANNLVRCLMGAGGTAIIIIMIDAMGRGWCFTFISLVVFAASPILWVLVKWGPQWREERRLRIKSK